MIETTMMETTVSIKLVGIIFAPMLGAIITLVTLLFKKQKKTECCTKEIHPRFDAIKINAENRSEKLFDKFDEVFEKFVEVNALLNIVKGEIMKELGNVHLDVIKENNK